MSRKSAWIQKCIHMWTLWNSLGVLLCWIVLLIPVTLWEMSIRGIIIR